MHRGWNKGLTKETHPSVAKISATMRRRKIDNFKAWREKMKREGKIKNEYPPFEKNGNLAELIGIVLGDGHIYLHERCDSLRITGDGAKMGFVNRSAQLIESVFGKKPTISKVRGSNAMTVTIYQKHISSRLGVPHGDRANLKYELPGWIRESREYTIRFLRGLYEAEGSLSHHPPTSTHKLTFTNFNPVLLHLVSNLVEELGFKTCISGPRVQVSREAHVQKLADLLQFRHYGT
jgi:hypothetical protein